MVWVWPEETDRAVGLPMRPRPTPERGIAMKRITACLMLLMMAGTATAESIAVPWEEIKRLYRESVERGIVEKSDQPATIHSLDEAVYRLCVSEDSAQGEVSLSGKIVSGTPASIPLFNREMIVSHTSGVTGGALVSDGEGIRFVPEEGAREFKIALGFLTRVRCLRHRLRRSRDDLSLSRASGTIPLETGRRKPIVFPGPVLLQLLPERHHRPRGCDRFRGDVGDPHAYNGERGLERGVCEAWGKTDASRRTRSGRKRPPDRSASIMML